jgi:hypothetical protein
MLQEQVLHSAAPPRTWLGAAQLAGVVPQPQLRLIQPRLQGEDAAAMLQR